MPIVKTSCKGQVVIPKEIRRKFKLTPGKLVYVHEKDGHIMVDPLPKDPIKSACGSLKGGSSLIKSLLRQRREDIRREG